MTEYAAWRFTPTGEVTDFTAFPDEEAAFKQICDSLMQPDRVLIIWYLGPMDRQAKIAVPLYRTSKTWTNEARRVGPAFRAKFPRDEMLEEMPCKNCGRGVSAHSNEKCLFASTNWQRTGILPIPHVFFLKEAEAHAKETERRREGEAARAGADPQALRRGRPRRCAGGAPRGQGRHRGPGAAGQGPEGPQGR